MIDKCRDARVVPWKEHWGLKSGEMGFCPENRYNCEQVTEPLRASVFSVSCESVFHHFGAGFSLPWVSLHVLAVKAKITRS